MQVQLAWEESRDAECDFIKDMSQDKEEAALNELICLQNHNLDRFEQLQIYYNEWYAAPSNEE